MISIIFLFLMPALHPACTAAEHMSEAAYTQALRDWLGVRPEFPGMISALSALKVYVFEKSDAVSAFRSDKKMHCFLGCRIARTSSVIAAHYAAWEKERQDLTDCSSQTKFEIKDVEATLWGAERGVNTHVPDCLSRPS